MKSDLDRLMAAFFRAVSFSQGEQPPYEQLYGLFIDNGLLIKNSLAAPEIATVRQFIEPRALAIRSGQLTAFRETELAERSELFGNVAQRFSTYEKTGTQDGTPFTARGMIATQFVLTPGGWKISAMAWDDERPGLRIPDHYAPPARDAAE